MKIAVRLDDITPDMDWDKFYEFKAILDMYGIRPLIGVVPENQDKNLRLNPPKEGFWDYIRQLQEQGWIVAMHGLNHVYDSAKGGIFPLNHFSEFAGHSLDVQMEKIRRGKEILQENGIETDFFMAPAHTYDENTLKALVENGFKNITDGFGEYPYQWMKLMFYPISFRMSDSLKKDGGYTTMVVHTNTIDDMEYYKKMFAKHQDQFVSYSDYMKIMPEARNKSDMIREHFMAVLKHWLVKLK